MSSTSSLEIIYDQSVTGDERVSKSLPSPSSIRDLSENDQTRLLHGMLAPTYETTEYIRHIFKVIVQP